MAEDRFENASDFEKLIKLVLQKSEGWDVELAEVNTRGYDLVAIDQDEKFAVQVKNIKRTIYLPQIKKFEAFLAQPGTKTEFSQGIFISSSGFAKTVHAYIESEGLDHIKLGTYNDGQVLWGKEEKSIQDDKPSATPPKKVKEKYIGVFTGKGGVGKTTVSAHLAGAFALCGYNVALLDLDVQGNLRKLLGEGVYLPGSRGSLGAEITVLDHHEWDSASETETKIVICDCNPEFDKNPKDLMEKFDYCIIPTTLNPLGVNKNADVISRTFKDIRSINKNAELFVVINNFYSSEEKRNRIMNRVLKNNLEGIIGNDPKFYYIDPLEDLAIRFSKQLLYWGYETLIENAEPTLAFTTWGGRCHPRTDFLSLAEYIIDHSNIDELKVYEEQEATRKYKAEVAARTAAARNVPIKKKQALAAKVANSVLA
jgi:chromosome partitioning protein